ncbi:hypothetical protein SAMN05421640_3649 [Ekhidna lutea]|uniref:MetA-pathway of phenol degradation n=1 Tax=Ekhidna lutea TaxID=447679 RepID=A0A239M776_EKHLU|nr:hypothetical protein [Ekhidna lutea]SNT37998.1 hypothetical protein SAMN05421640_3649 [Ekhidna lutea]
MLKLRHLILIASSLLLVSQPYAQGCSDAGFCTMGAMKPDQNYSKRIAIKLRSIELNYYKGTSIISPVISAATIDFNLGINDYSAFQIKVPYMWITGNLGDNAGLGDISLSYTRLLKATNNWNVNGTLGAKLPSNDANATISNEHTGGMESPLHMYYQTSLGSYDAIAGVSALSGEWLLATGIQIALTENNNQFVWSDFPNYPDREYLEKNNRGIELKRGIDVMLRVERNWRFTNFNFSLGALPIYRITKDEAIIPGTTERGKIEGTTGLALSILGSFGYHFDVNNSVKIIQGIKLVDRDVNPDGLTRDEVLSISYVYKF